jgi:CBS domain-containing protein
MIVSEMCRRNPVTIGADEELDSAARLGEMRRVGVRRVPVVDAVGQLVDAVAHQLLGVIGSIRTEVQAETTRRP